MKKTLDQYREVVDKCKAVFLDKHRDYGVAWHILRLSSLTDQMYIKARRIRSLEENGTRKVDEGIEPEYIGLINYGVMSLIKLDLSPETIQSLALEDLTTRYDSHVEQARALMMKKNHDYGEAWRYMRISSLTDLILMKLLRIRQIEDNEGKTLISEGLDANYIDIINYSIFALIRLREQTRKS
ncbi:MAG: DUF1599 domain-containing protein [Bacteroidetes bacterium]|nr:DUF1599 domain-containing protein [Bacteroidota bacterium]